MASTDALPIPRKNTAYRVIFPIMKSDGTIITSWSGAAATISKDQASSGAATNTPTEIATTWGIGYLDLTSAEMNCDCLAIKITVTNVGAVTTPLVLYPMEDVDIRSNVVDWNGTSVASPDTAGYPVVTVKHGTGTGEINLTSGVADANVTNVAGTSQTAVDIGAKLDATISSRMATFSLPTNFGSLSIDSSGRVTVISNADKTGYGLSSAAVQAVWDALTANLTTVGSIGKLLVTDVDAAISSRSTYAGGDTSGVTTLLSLLTSSRAGYLDNLNVGGHVASSAEVTAIQNNTRVVRVVPDVFERPDSGSTAFRIELLIYDDVGNMEAPDSAPTIDVVNNAGTSRNSNLDSTTMTLVSTGRYRSTYTIDTAHAIEQLIFAFTVVEGSASRVYGNTGFVVDTTAVDFTAADRTKLNAINAKLPSKTYLTGTENTDGSVEADALTGTLTVDVVNDKTGYGLVDGAITAAKIATDAIGSDQLAEAAITEIQAGLATSTNVSDLQSHGDSSWATRSLVLGIESDLHQNIIDSQAAVEAHGDVNWLTADVSGISTLTSSQVRTQADAALAALRLGELMSAAFVDPAFSGSVMDILLSNADLWAEDLQTHGYTGTQAGAVLLEIFQRAMMISEEGTNFVGIVNPVLQEFAIVQDTDYTVTSGAILPEWSSADWTAVNLLTATVTFRTSQLTSTSTIFSKTMDVVDATHVRLQLTAAETGALVADKTKPYFFQIIATLSNGMRYPLVATGRMLVVAKI